MSGRRRIAILGGGYTGLAAAYDLSGRHEVTLYERGASLGGLAGDFSLHGGSLERAYHHLFRSDKDIIQLVDELGIEQQLRWLPASMAVYRDGAFFPFSGAVDLLRFPPLSLPARLRLGFAMWRLSRTTQWRPFAEKTAYAWLLENAGEDAVSVLWEPLLKAKFHDAYRSISMAWLWARIHIRARSRASLLGQERLGYFNGGFATLTGALEESIRLHGAHVRTSTNVRLLRRAKDGRIEVETPEDRCAYDQVLVTAPSPIFAHMLPKEDSAMEKYKDALGSTRYLAAMTCIFSSTQRLTDAYWTNIVQEDNPFLVIVHHTALVGAEEFDGRYIYYLGQYLPETHPDFVDEEGAVIKRWLDALGRMVPDFRRECIQELRLFKFRYAQHVVTTGYTTAIVGNQTPWPGLYLANFSQTFPEDRGTNFAIRDGRAVAALMERQTAVFAVGGHQT